MIELPEAYTIASQMNAALPGRRIAEVTRGNTPHKFAFYNHTPQEYAQRLVGRVLGQAHGDGSFILLAVEPDRFLLFGDGGERITLHADASSLPKKHHFLLRFEDGAYLTITVQGWGFVQLIGADEFPPPYYREKKRVSPLGPDFTAEFFESLFCSIKPDDTRSVKYFLISKPGIWGVGNGCLQDILFKAGLHPRHRVMDLSSAGRQGLYRAVRDTLQAMADQGGRDSEPDLFGRPGGYVRLVHNDAVGRPCPVCGVPIEKSAYLGGAIYFCPRCQV